MTEDFLSSSCSQKSEKISTVGKIVIGVTGTIAVGISVVTLSFVSPAFRKHCLPYVPATNQQVKNVLKAIENKRGKLIDLGSGDGRIVLEAAKKNFIAHGVELNPWLVAFSRVDAIRRGLQSKSKFFCQDLWKFNLQPYDKVVIFGVGQMMNDLETKILKECNESCQIVACRFPLPTLQARHIIGTGLDTVWVYDLKTK